MNGESNRRALRSYHPAKTAEDDHDGEDEDDSDRPLKMESSLLLAPPQTTPRPWRTSLRPIPTTRGP